jgi:hypothetical protein
MSVARPMVALVWAALAVAGGAAAATPTGQPPQRAQEQPPPTDLWQRFPLEQGRLFPLLPSASQSVPSDAPAPPAATVAGDPAPAGTERGGSGDRSWLLVGIIAAVAGALAGLLAVRLTLGTRRGERLPALPVALSAATWNTFRVHLARQTGGNELPEAGMSNGGRTTDGGRAADVGARVNLILQAAEEAAEQIRVQAAGDAEAIRQEAKAATAEQIEVVRGEAERLRAEAERYDQDTRAAGDTYAVQRRREVDEQVSELLTDAEQNARATREAAEALAKQLESEAQARAHGLEEKARAIEARLQRVLVALRTTSSQIEDVLVAGGAGAETLLEALDVERRT